MLLNEMNSTISLFYDLILEYIYFTSYLNVFAIFYFYTKSFTQNKYSYILHSAYPYKFFRKLKNEIYKTDYDTYYAT